MRHKITIVMILTVMLAVVPTQVFAENTATHGEITGKSGSYKDTGR